MRLSWQRVTKQRGSRVQASGPRALHHSRCDPGQVACLLWAPEHLFLYDEEVEGLWGPFWHGGHRWAQRGQAHHCKQHPCPRGCFFKKETNVERPEGQESRCQDEVSVTNENKQALGSRRRKGPAGEVPGEREVGGAKAPPSASSRPQVTGDSQELPHSQRSVSAGSQHKAWKGDPQGSKRALQVSLSQPLFLTSGFTGGPQETP